MTITPKHLQDVCLLNHPDISKTCRYLSQDELDSNKWHCQKLRSYIKFEIDLEVETHNKLNTKIPSGNNCGGYLLLRNIDQGYDVD